MTAITPWTLPSATYCMDTAPQSGDEHVASQHTEVLLRQAQAGDSEALSSLLQRYRDRVLRIARIRMGTSFDSHIDAEDITQETLRRAWEQLSAFDPRQAPRLIDWLAAIAQNCIRDASKRRLADKRDARREQSLEALRSPSGSQFSISLADPDGTPSQFALARERAEAHDRCMTELSERHREVLLLRLYADLSWEDIAPRVSCPNPHAAIQLYLRARAALDEKLRRCGYDNPQDEVREER